MLEKHPNRVIEHSVAGMLPKNKLKAEMLKNLKVYATEEHKHEAQKPELIKVEA
jgi:large subunit ribosomal protein L13